MKISLTKSRSSRDRYYLLKGRMGNYGCPANHANHHFEIANGIDRGCGFQGYMSVGYFLKQEGIPQEAKDKVIKILKQRNLTY